MFIDEIVFLATKTQQSGKERVLGHALKGTFVFLSIIISPNLYRNTLWTPREE